jgi:hypothetical protein
VTLRWAQNDVIGRFKEKAVEAEIHTNMAVAKAWNIRHLRFIEIPFRERAAASAATANPFGNQCGCAA